MDSSLPEALSHVKVSPFNCRIKETNFMISTVFFLIQFWMPNRSQMQFLATLLLFPPKERGLRGSIMMTIRRGLQQILDGKDMPKERSYALKAD